MKVKKITLLWENEFFWEFVYRNFSNSNDSTENPHSKSRWILITQTTFIWNRKYTKKQTNKKNPSTLSEIFSNKYLRYRAKFWQWRHHYYADVIIVAMGKIMKNFKYCAISLNVVLTDGLSGVLGFTAPLILISKNFQDEYIYSLNSALCALIARAAIKVIFGCLIEMVDSHKSYKTPG